MSKRGAKNPGFCFADLYLSTVSLFYKFKSVFYKQHKCKYIIFLSEEAYIAVGFFPLMHAAFM